jgi:hypothetical protein
MPRRTRTTTTRRGDSQRKSWVTIRKKKLLREIDTAIAVLVATRQRIAAK